ncbi:hypothetical protein CDD83_9741 [Cordyceps sp. RAO-2017]|nr:hypothetical protein CDD83_9741 [Cordyceps sp. RAO-2017]
MPSLPAVPAAAIDNYSACPRRSLLPAQPDLPSLADPIYLDDSSDNISPSSSDASDASEDGEEDDSNDEDDYEDGYLNEYGDEDRYEGEGYS